MRKTDLRNKGITLIALVVTIIVLLILAGITISTLFGDNGIISAARKAAEETKKGEEDVSKQLGDLADEMQSQTTGPVVGTREDWNVSEDGRLGLYKGAIPEDGVITIPTIVDGIKITKIGLSLEESTIISNENNHNGVTSIFYKANEYQYNGSTQIYNSSVKKIIIPNGILELRETYCFAGSSALQSVILPDSLKVIPSRAFYNCTKLENIRFGKNITKIGFAAFDGCKSLANITIPNSVTSIEGYAFYNCTGLANIIIPNSVTSIGNYAFNNCTSLTTVNYTGTKSQWNAITKGSYNTALTNAKIHCTDGDIN